MNNQVLMEEYLLILKSTVEVYIHGTLESSNDEIRKVLYSGLEDTLKHQERVYNEMVNYGWYQVSNVDKKTIKQTFEKCCEN